MYSVSPIHGSHPFLYTIVYLDYGLVREHKDVVRSTVMMPRVSNSEAYVNLKPGHRSELWFDLSYLLGDDGIRG